MADESRQQVHHEREGGIFIPYDKLLQQQSDKLDKILEELREMDRRKLDVPVFESFRVSYEQRHESLKSDLAAVVNITEARDSLIEEYKVFKKDTADRLDVIETYKAEREAVQEQMRYFWTGGALVGLLVVVNLIVNAYQIISGGTP